MYLGYSLLFRIRYTINLIKNICFLGFLTATPQDTGEKPKWNPKGNPEGNPEGNPKGNPKGNPSC